MIDDLENMNENLQGVAVVMIENGKVLLTLRKKGDNVGCFELPAGHIETGEDPEDTATREVLEEIGLVIDELVHLKDYGNTRLFRAQKWHGELVNVEPEQHESLAWHDLNNLPTPSGPSLQVFVELN